MCASGCSLGGGGGEMGKGGTSKGNPFPLKFDFLLKSSVIRSSLRGDCQLAPNISHPF